MPALPITAWSRIPPETCLEPRSTAAWQTKVPSTNLFREEERGHCCPPLAPLPAEPLHIRRRRCWQHVELAVPPSASVSDERARHGLFDLSRLTLCLL